MAARRCQLLAAAFVACGVLVGASSTADGTTRQGADRCDELTALSDDLADLELKQEFDAAGYRRLAVDFADAVEDAPPELRKPLATSAKFYAKVGRSKTEKAAIRLYVKGLTKYADEFEALDDYLADTCGVTPENS